LRTIKAKIINPIKEPNKRINIDTEVELNVEVDEY
jgi:hypothetical protein